MREKILVVFVVFVCIMLMPNPMSSRVSIQDSIPQILQPSPEFENFILSENGILKRYDRGGTTTFNSTSGVYSYSTSVGMANTWNGTDYLPYIWDPVERTVKIGNATISHNPNGALTIEGDSGILIGRLSWYAQYYLDSVWNNVTLDNYAWQGFTFNEYNITARQRFWGPLGELNVTIIYRNMNELKITVDVTNWAGQNVPIRVFWVAAQLENVAGNYDLVFDNDGNVIAINIGNFSIGWSDVVSTTPDIFVNTLVDKPNRRAAIQFGNISNIIDAGATWIIDPFVETWVEGDLWDDTWERTGTTWSHGTGYEDNILSSGSTSWYAQVGFVVAIPKDTIIFDNTVLYVWQKGGGSGTPSITVTRIVDATEDLGPLEDDTTIPNTRPSNDPTPTDTEVYSLVQGWRVHDTNIGAMVQEQVNKAGWVSGYHMGFKGVNDGSLTRWWEDFSDPADKHAKLVVWYTTNIAPVNDQAPTCSELDGQDTDRLLAEYKYYSIVVYVSDANGYADIDYIHLVLYDDARSDYEWIMRYDEDTNLFSEWIDSQNEVEMSGSSASRSGDDIDATFEIRLHWNHDPIENSDLRVIVYDSEPTFDDDYYEVDWDWESRLQMGLNTMDDGAGTIDRGDYDTVGGVEASATVVYLGAGTWNFPLATEIDIWVLSDDTPDPDWQATNYDDTDGTWEVMVDSDNIVTGSPTTYYFIAVAEGTGAGGTDLCYSSEEATYKADRIQVQSLISDDPRIDVSTLSENHVTLQYDYDDVIVATGTITVNSYSTVYSGSGGIWDFGINQGTVGDINWNDVVATGDDTHGLTEVDMNGKSVLQIWDRVLITSSVNYGWSVIGFNVTITYSGIYDYDDNPWDGVGTWDTSDASLYPNETVYGDYNYDVVSITDPTHGLTVFVPDTVYVTFDEIYSTTSIAKYWTQYSATEVNLIWGLGSYWKWHMNDTWLDYSYSLHAYSNGSAPTAVGGIYGSGSFGGISVGFFDPSWYYVNITVNCEVTIGDRGFFDWLIWQEVIGVDILHSLQIVNFNIIPTDDHFWIVDQTNLLNASITIWDDAVDSGTLFANNIYYSTFEGMHQIDRSTIIGVHNVTICITSTAIQYDRDYTVHDYTWWYNFTYLVLDPPSYDSHLVILNNLYELIPFDTFEVYVNSTRVYHDIIQVVEGYTYNITVMNRFGDTVDMTTFDADFEMVIFVNVYSLKFMSWYENFIELNITRASVTYTEIVMPMEIVEYELYAGIYNFSIDYLNGSAAVEFINYDHANSTGWLISGHSIADIMSLVGTVYDLSETINITVTSTKNYALTISIDLTNINTTINEQLIQVLLNITNTNSTIFDQTVDLLAYMQNVNSTLYNQAATFIVAVYNNQTIIFDQTVSILATLTIIGSNVTANFISLSADLLAIDSNLYTNFTSVSATLALMDSSLLSNFTSISASLLLINSTLVSNFTAVTATLSAIGSNITSNYLSLAATLLAMDSSLLSNFTSISATLALIDSSLLSNFTAVTATLTAIGSNITTNYLSLAATLSAMDSSLLSNFTSISASLLLINSTLVSNFTAVTATLTAIGSNITANYLSVSATLLAMDSSLLSNFTSISATLALIDSSLLSNFTAVTATLLAINSSLVSNFTYIMANLTAIGSNITANYLSVSATLLAMDSSLLSNFTVISATLALIDSSLLSNFTTIITTLSAIGSNITAQTLTLVATIENVNSTIYNQTLTILTRILNINSTIYEQGVDVLTQIYNMNSTLYAQTITMLLEVNEVEELAKTIKGLTDTIKGEVADQPTPVDMSDIFNVMIIAVLVFTLVIIIVWGVRAVWRDKREGVVTKDSQLDKDIDLDDDIEYK